MNWTRISIIIGVIVGIITILGSFTAYMSTFAKAEDVKEVKMSVDLTQKRLEQKIITDRIISLEERKDRIQSKDRINDYDKERIYEYQRDIKELEIQLDNLYKKSTDKQIDKW